MTKTIIVSIEVYNEAETEQIERIIGTALNSKGIDCTYTVEATEE